MTGLNSLNSNNIPLVAIAGRPNVGKSTLFNRIIGKRKAITDPVPGVTRDPVEEICVIGDTKIRLTDTGGYKLDQEALDDLVVSRALEVIDAADLVLLVLDIKETTPEDEILIEALRPYTEKILLVVNKVDGPEKMNEIWNFYSYGFDNIYPISATHGIGIGDLLEVAEARVKGIAGSSEFIEEDADIRISILGKPNTGKSTLINSLTGKKHSIVSDIPGTTRDIVEGSFVYKDNRFRILDTAGIRRKKKVTEDVEYYSVNRAIKSIDLSDIILLMMDAEEGLTDQDKKIAGLAVRKGKGIILVLNKWDLMKDVPNAFEAVADRVRFLFPVLSFAPIVPLSALKSEGVDVLLDNVLKVWWQLNRRVETSALNAHLKDWVEENEPPRTKTGRFKIKYITQVSANPHHFIAFVNRNKNFPEFYARYLMRMIRQDFGLNLIPLTLDFRE